MEAATQIKVPLGVAVFFIFTFVWLDLIRPCLSCRHLICSAALLFSLVIRFFFYRAEIAPLFFLVCVLFVLFILRFWSVDFPPIFGPGMAMGVVSVRPVSAEF